MLRQAFRKAFGWRRKAKLVKDNQTIYSECYKDPKYAMGEQRFERVTNAVNDAVLRMHAVGEHEPSLLDVGCGRGEILRWAHESNDFYTVTGEEIVPDLCGVFAGYDVYQRETISKSDLGADIVVCSDVLEHIQPMETEAALRRLWESTFYTLIIHVAWFPTERVMEDGTVEQLHINCRNALDWVSLLAFVTGNKAECFEYDDQTALLIVNRVS